MYKLFRRKKDKPSLMYGVFQKIGSVLENKQRQICNKLNKKTEKLTMRQLKIGLAIFSVVYLGCITVIMMQLLKPGNKAMYVQPIRVPVQVVPDAGTDSLNQFWKFYKQQLKSK